MNSCDARWATATKLATCSRVASGQRVRRPITVLLDGYIRVSQVGKRKGERFISPKVQREQIEGWVAARKGAHLAEVFEELNQSGGRSDRPKLLLTLERVESGETEGVIVAKIDRFGRVLIEGLRAIKRIEDAGGTFVSVQDGIDLSTPTGKFVMQVLFSVGEWELERVRDSWDIAREHAIARGAYVGNHPIGYLRDDNGCLRVDRERAPLVREIFERRVDGQPCHEIASALNEAGVRTRDGYPFNPAGVYKILRNPAYHGEARHGVHRNPSAHEAIVDRALWQRAQHTPRPRAKRIPALLGGLVRCGSCGHMLSSARPEGPDSPFHVYRCDNRAKACRAPAMARADELDPLIEEFIFSHFRRAASLAARERIAASEAAIAEASEALASFRDEPSIRQALSAWSFSEGLASRQLELDKRLVDLDRARRERGTRTLDIDRLESDWTELDWQQRRHAVARLLDCVIVERGREPVLERARVFRWGKGPVGLVDGRLAVTATLLAEDGEPLRRHRRWPLRRLERELRVFLAGRERWPEYREFAAAGRARLFAQVQLRGGHLYWARKFGLETGRAMRWNREVIRGALELFLAKRNRWPRAREFTDAGLGQLYYAVKFHGGVRYWAEEFGIEYGPARRREWTKRRITSELERFTRGRGDFPTRTEFYETGRRPLYDAAVRYGGIAYWVKRLRLEPSLRPHELGGRGNRRAIELRREAEAGQQRA